MNLLNSIKNIISSMPNRDYEYPNLSMSQTRVISLHLPRRSGKTTTIRALSREYSSLVLVPSHHFNVESYDGEAFTSLEGIERTFRGRYSFGLKYRYILIDEATKVDLDKLVLLLNTGDLLEKDYFIVQLGTPVV